MTDQAKPQTAKPGMDARQQPKDGVKSGGTVGRDMPDESKERHTEIAVEAGRKGSEKEMAKEAGRKGSDDKP